MTSELPKRAFERYELVRRLGEGGAGTVYVALDRETGAQVALKTLTRMTPLNVLRFKREFRALADIRHRNLAKLYELEHADDGWFLTMELIDGVPFLHGLDPALDDDGPASQNRERAIFERFHQLAQGVQAIHHAGMLHCDLKPSNVMLEHGGRVVVLDFGLVREQSANGADLSVDGTTSGTPAYMPPEQARGEELSEASDWYAFGAMLYEALSGVLPIDGRNGIELIQRKLHFDAPNLPPSAGPRAVRELCTELLQRNPRERAGAQEILQVLSELVEGSTEQDISSDYITLTTEAFAPDTQTGQAATELFGREAERLQLEAALASCVRKQSCVCEHVCGPSGSGKTALVQSFLAGSAQLVLNPLVLRSRCYERETIAFKSIDGIVDAIVTFLITLDDIQIAHLLPRNLSALTALFPAFEHIPTVQRLLGTQRLVNRGDTLQLRRRAEEEFRSLLCRIAQRQPVVIWIDDLQWGDLDSAQMLQGWLARPFEAPVLVILTYRGDEVATSACLSALVSDAAKQTQSIEQHTIELRPMNDSDVHALCTRRFGALGSSAPIIAKIVRDAHGNPFLATQLTALAKAKLSRGDTDVRSLSVEHLVLHTSSLLSESALHLLRVLSVAGRPLAPRIALQAASVTRDPRARVHELQTLRLVRTRYVSGEKLLEIYHDRVRTSIDGALSEGERRQIHQTLLQVVLAHGGSDAAWLHELALGAGQRPLARHYGLLAADAANANLAFERAAELYERCLEYPTNDSDRLELLRKLAAAHVRCRRGKQAARVYLEASKLAKDQARIELLRQAASHLLRSGYFEEGERVVQQVLEGLDISVPSSELGLYAAIGWERTRIAVLQRTVTPRADVVLPPDEKRLGTMYAMLALDTQCHSPLRAALFQMRATRMCFQYGERQTTARAYCLNAVLATLSSTSAHVDEMLARAEALIDVSNDPETMLELYASRAVCAANLGREAEMIEPARAAEQLYATNSAGGELGDYFYMFVVRAMLCSALQFLGRHNEASEEVRRLLADAAATDNRCAALLATMVRTGHEQVDNCCRESRARLDAERAELPAKNFTPLHLLHTMAVLRAACHTGEHDWALDLYADFEPQFESSPLKRSVYLVYLLRIHHARLVLNRHVALGLRSDAEPLFRADLRWLKKHTPPSLHKPAELRLLARSAAIRGERTRAAELFEQSQRAHTQLGAADDVERDRYALGLLQGGDPGSQLVTQAVAALSSLGVREPTREIHGFFPELFR